MRSSGGGSSSSFLTSQSYSCSYDDLACDYTLQVQQCLFDRTSCFMWCVYCLFKVCAHISRWVVAQALQRTARWDSHCCGFLKQLSGTDASSRCHTNKSATHNVHLEARGSEPRRLCTGKNTTSPVLISCPVWQGSQTFLKKQNYLYYIY